MVFSYATRDLEFVREREIIPPPERIRRVLAIDPGTQNLAVCYLEIGGTPKTMKIEPPDTIQTIAGAVRYLQGVLQWWLASRDVDLIIKEGIAHGKKFGVAEAGRLQHMIEEVAMMYRIPYITVNPTTMRAFMKSKEKSDTKLKVFQRYGYEFASEDETDAYAILETGLAGVRGEVNLGQHGLKKRKVA